VSGCPFCAIFADLSVATTRIVWVSRYDMILEPLDPVTPGHLIVVSGRHVASFAQDPRLFGSLAETAASYVRGLSDRGDWNVITSMGPAATQTVEHLHIHLVPRRPDDGLNLPWGR